MILLDKTFAKEAKPADRPTNSMFFFTVVLGYCYAIMTNFSVVKIKLWKIQGNHAVI
jgi:hypothetical protein